MPVVAAGFIALWAVLASSIEASAQDLAGLSAAGQPPRVSLRWTDVDELPATLQDTFDFGEIGPPDLQRTSDAGYQKLLDEAARDSAASDRAQPDDYIFVSHDSDR